MSAADAEAAGRLNRLHAGLLRENPDWRAAARRGDLDRFLARLIFCFFAGHTGIFRGRGLFIRTLRRVGGGSSANTRATLVEIFRALNTRPADRPTADLRAWATLFPFVGGDLFSGGADVPCVGGSALFQLLSLGELDWARINPDIFGAMTQAVADDEERSLLGLHYTSAPNILKALGPLFLDDLRARLDDAGNDARKLLRLRRRLARIRVFDPACGSGNFLVAAYREMRAVEVEIDRRRGETGRRSDLLLANFRGIELRPFSCEVARLALRIAQRQGDTHPASLPLEPATGIVCGNALLTDWRDVCPPGIDPVSAGETYLCGNPPYKGSKWQSPAQKSHLRAAWHRFPRLAKTTDYAAGWIARYLDYVAAVPDTAASFVVTNSLCQGQQAGEIWPAVFGEGIEIRFAHRPFQWSNPARGNAGVTVVIVGLGKRRALTKKLYDGDRVRECSLIGPYLVPDRPEAVEKRRTPIGKRPRMLFGNMPRDGGHLFLNSRVAAGLRADPDVAKFVRRFVGSEELIRGTERYCLWIGDEDRAQAEKYPLIATRLERVAASRRESRAASTRDFARWPHRFVQIAGVARQNAIVIPRVSSENREFLPVDYLTGEWIVGDRNFALYDAPLWNLALVASRLHRVWIGTVCVRLRTDFSYSNTLGWNTFPVPAFTARDEEELTRCAEGILRARGAHFPATIADLYAPGAMPADLRAAHARNDETLERLYLERPFKDDAERLEKLFALYVRSREEEPRQVVKHRRGKTHRVDPVEHPAVPADERAVILHSATALDGR